MHKIQVITIILFFLLLVSVSAEAIPSNQLNFNTIKAKYIDVDINLEIPMSVSNYNENSKITFKTPIFYNSTTQQVEISAFYYNNLGEKIPAEIIEDEYGNSIAVFEIETINMPEYVFYIQGNVKSTNKIIFTNNRYDLKNEINDYNEYKLPTENIQPDRSEIISITNAIKKSDDAIEELTNIVDWVHQTITYDLSYVSEIVDSISVLSNRKGVCDEFANLTAAILRARGYPVRYISGYANSTIDWQAHAWLEVYVPNQGWIPVDPTFGEVGFVDATHITLTRAKDPSDVGQYYINLTSELDLDATDRDFTFVINEQKSYVDMGYSNVLDITLDAEKDMKEKSAFTITAKVKNTTANPLTNSLSLLVHDSFIQIYPNSNEKIVYLDAMEEKELVYHFILPDLDTPMYYTYILGTQIEDIEGSVNIYTDSGLFQEAFFVLEPIFYFKEGIMFMEMDIINHTSENKKLNFDFNFNNIMISETNEIEPNTSSVYSKAFSDINEGTIEFVLSGDYDYSKIINIYPDMEIEVIEIEPEIEELDENAPSIWKEIEDLQNVPDRKKISSAVAIVIVALFVIVIALIFVLRPKKPKSF